MQYDRSLLTVDIQGAQPKSRNAYMNRLLPNQMRFEEQIRVQQQNPKQDYKFGRRRYQHDFHHFCNICIPQGEEHFEKSNKKHFVIPEGEIKQYRALENYYDQPKQIEIDRLLCTNDIDGAVPGSLQSKAVRNQEMAQKLRIQREEQRIQKKRALYQSQLNQSYDQQEDSPQPQRKKSYSVQISPVQQQEQKTQAYEYLNKPLKLPPISDRITTFTNPTSSKIQLKQNHLRVLDQDNTWQQIQKQPALRLFL
ncbi:unnamed protein product [Paramecium sonneborni]|uniref:Uncharacterized protein n=1 Tax=Paramecium sonneborni TaxID=65129 RepID=A0A8S1QR14_9CILI|nr:unnamed protein product [Paramecium sonneborni]